MTLFTMRQGDIEPNDGYLIRFKSNVQSLELAGGEHIFTSEKIEGGSFAEDNAKKAAMERFKAVLFMKRSDTGRYGT